MTETPATPRKPERPPTPADLAERDRFANLAEASLSTVRANAESWRNGLAAFVGLVTTAAILKGRDSTAQLTTGWHIAVTVLFGGGIALSVAGLWQALAAQAGTREGAVSLADIHRRHASVAAYEVALANTAAARLKRGRIIVVAALSSLLLGVAATWWAPQTGPSSTAYVSVSHDGSTTCGTLQSADGRSIRIQVAGVADPVEVRMSTVTDLLVVSHC